jgi:hypothetical protein
VVETERSVHETISALSTLKHRLTVSTASPRFLHHGTDLCHRFIMVDDRMVADPFFGDAIQP